MTMCKDALLPRRSTREQHTTLCISQSKRRNESHKPNPNLYQTTTTKVRKSSRTARRWLTKASDASGEAAYNLALMVLDEGQEKDNPTLIAEAVNRLKRAAELGVRDACFNVGVAYFKGSGVERNLDTAVEWFVRCM